MGAVLRPCDALVLPYRFAHRYRHDGVVAGGKGQDGASKFVFSFSCVPMHQPIEPFVEASDVERARQGKARGAARPPERLEGSVRLALDPPLERGDARRRNVAAEAVEALHADQGPETACPALKQPQQPKRMADRDRVGRPVRLALGPARDKAEIDEGDAGPFEMANDIGPDAGMEAPTMDEHEM